MFSKMADFVANILANNTTLIVFCLVKYAYLYAEGVNFLFSLLIIHVSMQHK